MEGSIPLEREGRVGSILLRGQSPQALLVLAHGAGAGMRHPFLEAYAALLAGLGIATLRYQFPYMERGSRRPDPSGLLLKTVVAAADAGAAAAAELGVTLFVGGKSMGGRMTSMAVAAGMLPPSIHGLVMVGYPLAGRGRSPANRAAHLGRITLPMLFLQGTRDALADIDAMGNLCAGLSPLATLHTVDGGDHSFHVPKRSGRTDGEVLDELAGATAAWVRARS